MKTDDLITMLSSGPDVALAARPVRATALPLLGGLFASATSGPLDNMVIKSSVFMANLSG